MTKLPIGILKMNVVRAHFFANGSSINECILKDHNDHFVKGLFPVRLVRSWMKFGPFK